MFDVYLKWAEEMARQRVEFILTCQPWLSAEAIFWMNLYNTPKLARMAGY